MSELSLVMQRLGDALEIAFIRDGRLENFWHRDPQAVSGTLFRARVSDIDRTLDGAFLDAGLSDLPAAFMQGRDLKKRAASGSKGKRQSIERLLQVGQFMIVQGTREAVGDKGPRVTGRPRLEGRYLIFSPFDERHSVSPRHKGRARDELLERLERIRPDGGLIGRRLAIQASDQELKDEALELEHLWQELSQTKGRPGRLNGWLDPFETTIWQALDWPIERIALSDPALSARLRAILERVPDAFELERLDTTERVFDFTGVSDELALAASIDVPLDGGGHIRIEETAACVAIDVDGGGRPAIEANLSASEEIGRQCRLRNLGGNIIIDFIDMPTKPQVQKLEEALRRAFRFDPTPVQILPISPLGIAQISRARRGGNPFASRRKTCPTCGGDGSVSA